MTSVMRGARRHTGSPSEGHTFYLVRHGQSTWNTERRIQGQTMHVPLTAVGRVQARRVASALHGCGVAALFTSDQLRALQTADVLAGTLRLRPRLTTALREQALGSFEGRFIADISRRELDEVTALGPDARPGGGESIKAVYGRVGVLLADLLESSTGAATVLVSHGDTIRAAQAWLEGLAPEHVPPAVPPNGSITEVQLRGRAALATTVHVPADTATTIPLYQG